MSLKLLYKFDHLESRKDFIENVIPEMSQKTLFLELNYETTMSILNKKWVTIMIWYVCAAFFPCVY